MENEVFVDGKAFSKTAEMFPEETFSHKISQLLSSYLIYQDDSSRVNSVLHFLYIPNPLCKHTHTCTYMYVCLHLHTLLHCLSLPMFFFCFLQLLSYTEMQNDSFFCLVQTCFPLSLTTEFKSSDFGCRGALSLVAFLFFQVFLIL